ncbi:hypothetical protein [Phosphitispora fastidiosa]|uniref:hypothetical protein n=1 Tax=Phosphitispora fastidiosa TaxID=2837202 RepID=UPI001E3AA03D|nr:hypothetical protein [Phosphitispora fastidiosa]MBU7007018.1 hypothetical protein [Phosphitispora fastidiosa]
MHYILDNKSILLGTIVIIVFGVFIPMSQAPYWFKETPLITFQLILMPLIISYLYIFSGSHGSDCTSRSESPYDFFGKVFAGFLVCYLPYIFICYTGLLTLNYVLYMNAEWHGIYMYSPPALFAFFFCGAAAVLFGLGSGYFFTSWAAGLKQAWLLGAFIFMFSGLFLLFGILEISFTWYFVLYMFLGLLAADMILLKLTLKKLKLPVGA